ncbi:MAG: hypothetical protein SPI54_08840, partial [Oscillospiraceae bacterium]|nr:hypothetical protein [Oscillospiraceae bacterium]
GAALLAINPISTAIICFLPRILAGFLSGLIFKAFKNKQGVISYAVTSLSTGVFNTLFFLAVLILGFSKESLTGLQLGDNLLQIVGAIITVNSVIEWVVCLVVGLAISKALAAVLKSKRA